MTEQSGPQRPLLRVVRGEPTPEELAALVTVFSARSTPPPADRRPAGRRSAWAAREALVRRPLPRGPGAWRTSTRPR